MYIKTKKFIQEVHTINILSYFATTSNHSNSHTSYIPNNQSTITSYQPSTLSIHITPRGYSTSPTCLK